MGRSDTWVVNLCALITVFTLKGPTQQAANPDQKEKAFHHFTLSGGDGLFSGELLLPRTILLRKSHHLRSEEGPGKAAVRTTVRKQAIYRQNIAIRSEHRPTQESAQAVKITGWARIMSNSTSDRPSFQGLSFQTVLAEMVPARKWTSLSSFMITNSSLQDDQSIQWV